MKHCPSAKKCGACTYIHTDYQEQLKMKREEIRKLYPKENVEPVTGMKDPYHYRHKIYASFYMDKTKKIRAGLYEESTHKTVNSEMCLIQHSKANLILKTVCETAGKLHIPVYDEKTGRGTLRHAYLRISHDNGDVLLVIVIGSKDLPSSKTFVSMLREKHPEIKTVVLNYNNAFTSMILGKRDRVIYGKGVIFDKIAGITFGISAHSFYQVNPEQTEKMYAAALKMAKLKDTDIVLDACCGIGTITLLAAQKAKKVIGVEINPAAVKDAVNNAKLNHITNAGFIADDAENMIRNSDIRPDVVFLDPPRSGLSESFLNTLGKKAPERIVYISCYPPTQAENINILKKYGYRIRKIVPFDNFPFTRHVETVVLLSRVK